MHKIKKAFTLSEVLITLSIIAVVAVLTIPSFVKNYRKKVYAARIVKLHNQLIEAITSEFSDEHITLDEVGNKVSFTDTKSGQETHCDDADKGICDAGGGYFLNKYFKLSKKNCSEGDCYAASYKTPKGEDAKGFDTNTKRYCAQTVDGVTICAYYDSDNSRTYFEIDTNGTDDPNITGYDAFHLEVVDNKIQDIKDAECNNKATVTKNNISDYAGGCMAKIIEDGNKIKY